MGEGGTEEIQFFHGQHPEKFGEKKVEFKF